MAANFQSVFIWPGLFTVTGANIEFLGNVTIDGTLNGVKIDGNATLYNTFLGNDTGDPAVGESNTGIGDRVLHVVTTGQANTAVGTHSMGFNTTGNLNVAMGHDALYSNISGTSNVAIGEETLWTNTTGSNITALGRRALFTNTVSSQVAVGFEALFSNTTGANNLGVGLQALYRNTTGGSNTVIGLTGAYSQTTASGNTVFGYEALYSNVTGSNNTVVGKDALFEFNTADGSGSNTVVGYNTGRGIVTGVKNTIVGANVTGLSSTLSNTILLADGDGTVRLTLDGTVATFATGTRAPSARLDDGFTVGTAADARYAVFIAPTFTSTGVTGALARWGGTLTLPTNASGSQVRFQASGITSASSGTHNLIAGVYAAPFTLTSGGATTANTATVYIESASTATVSGRNYAVWIDDGLFRFDGGGYSPAVTVASLPASPVAGMFQTVSDSTTTTWGATITGSGANTVLAFYNGANWTVAAK